MKVRAMEMIMWVVKIMTTVWMALEMMTMMAKTLIASAALAVMVTW
jgi:hypothetical protein